MALGRGGRRKGGLGQREALRHARVGLLARIGRVGRLRAQGGYPRARERMEEISAFSPTGFNATLRTVYTKLYAPTLTNLIMGFSRMGIG